MIFDDLLKPSASIIGGLQIMAGSTEENQKPAKILRPHVFVSAIKQLKIGTRTGIPGLVVEKTLDPLIGPYLVGDSLLDCQVAEPLKRFADSVTKSTRRIAWH